MYRSTCIVVSLVFLLPLLVSGQCSVEPNDYNILSSRLEGTWELDVNLSLVFNSEPWTGLTYMTSVLNILKTTYLLILLGF